VKRVDLILKSEIMFLVIALIALFHWIMALLWFIFNRVSEKTNYTVGKKEFIRCQYPISKNLRYKKYIKIINLNNYSIIKIQLIINLYLFLIVHY